MRKYPDIDRMGNKFWQEPNIGFHKKDGPAIEWANGNREWYLNNLLHRDDGPAIDYTAGRAYQAWYRNGYFHREDGPARVWHNGEKEWWYDGKKLKVSSDEEFFRLVRIKAFW